MHVRPQLQMLRSDDAPQRTAQRAVVEAAQAWRLQGDGAQLEAELGRFHAGDRLDDLPLLRALFDPECARAGPFLDGLLRPLLHRIGDAPLSLSPLRCSTGDVSTAIVLARCATSALTLPSEGGCCMSRRS